MRSLNNFYCQNSRPTESKMAATAILKIIFLPQLSHFCIYCICTKFNAKGENGFPEPDLASNVNYCKNPRWWHWRPPFWNQSNGNNSAIFEPICTKFDRETEHAVPDQILPAKLISHNWAIVAYICTEFNTVANNRVQQPDFSSKFTYCKNSRWRPSLFWNQLNGDNSTNIERNRTKFDTETDNQLTLPSKFR